MLLTRLEEGEHIFTLKNKKDFDCLRQTINRTNKDRPDKEYVFSCYTQYKENKIAIIKQRRNAESIE